MWKNLRLQKNYQKKPIHMIKAGKLTVYIFRCVTTFIALRLMVYIMQYFAKLINCSSRPLCLAPNCSICPLTFIVCPNLPYIKLPHPVGVYTPHTAHTTYSVIELHIGSLFCSVCSRLFMALKWLSQGTLGAQGTSLNCWILTALIDICCDYHSSHLFRFIARGRS